MSYEKGDVKRGTLVQKQLPLSIIGKYLIHLCPLVSSLSHQRDRAC
jgi:hypothetical protein